MYYYKLIVNRKKYYVTSNSFMEYVPEHKVIIGCSRENNPQYVEYKGEIYRIPWLFPEDESQIGKHPEAELVPISKKEYEENIKKEED